MSNFDGNHAQSSTPAALPLTSHDGGEPVPVPSTATSSPVTVPVETATPHGGGYVGEHGLSQPAGVPTTSHDEGTLVQVPSHSNTEPVPTVETIPTDVDAEGGALVIDPTATMEPGSVPEPSTSTNAPVPEVSTSTNTGAPVPAEAGPSADGPVAQTIPSAASGEGPTAAVSSTDAPLVNTSSPVVTAVPSSQIPEQGVPATNAGSSPLPSALPEPTSTTTPAAPVPDPASFFSNSGFNDGSWFAPSGSDGNAFGSSFGGDNSFFPKASNSGDTSNGGDQLATPWGSDQGLQDLFGGQAMPWAQPTQSGDGSGTGTDQLTDMFASAPWGNQQPQDGTSGGDFASMLPDGFASFF
ncbi:hypothetical protein GGF31_006136 [Allomyces arbusculus]|nr:hypothetical protein GGF31_006136 [Allomyces arbusculus]